jgi:hypothetical protein
MAKSLMLIFGLILASASASGQNKLSSFVQNGASKPASATQNTGQVQASSKNLNQASLKQQFEETSLGGDHSGGGSFTPADFMNKIREFLSFVKNSGGALQVSLEFAGTTQEIRLDSFMEIYRRGIQVHQSPEGDLYVDGRRVDFKNTPRTNEIATDDKAWASQASEVLKMQIAIHELLGLVQIPDPGYELSETLGRLMESGESEKSAEKVGQQAPLMKLLIDRSEVSSSRSVLYFKDSQGAARVTCGGAVFQGFRGSTLSLYYNAKAGTREDLGREERLSRTYSSELECLLAKQSLLSGIVTGVAITLDPNGIPQLEFLQP